MSFATNSYQQTSLFESTQGLTEREMKCLKRSWAYVFAINIFPLIDEEPFRVLYCQDNGAPNIPVNILVGACIIKELFGLSDDDMVEGLMMDVRFQYALHTTSFEEQPLSDKSLTRFRMRCLEYERETGVDLLHDAIINLSGEIAKLMKITGNTRRMDSLMIDANIKTLSRLELIYTCISNLLKRLDKEEVPLPESLKHYVQPNDYNQLFYYAKDTDYAERCTQLLNDADNIFDFCKDSYADYKEYLLFQRCMSEQTIVEETGRRLARKEDGTMNSSILQNPSDPDAAFRSKAGKEHRGYVANVEESVGEGGSVVTDYRFEQNTYSDSTFLNDSLKEMEPAQETVTIVVDGAYPTEDNIELASEKNVSIISTNMTGKKPDDIYADFTLSDDGTSVLSCPAGYEPTSCSMPNANGQMRVSFASKNCNCCPFKDKCKVKIGKRRSPITLSKSTVNRARAWRLTEGKDGKNYARLRNGVETIPSSLRRNYNLDKLPRGKLRGKLFFGCKIAALNFRKLFTYLNGLGRYAQNPVIA